MKNTINLELTLEEANLVMASLGKQPFEVVVELVGKIREQAQSQLSEAQESPIPQEPTRKTK